MQIDTGCEEGRERGEKSTYIYTSRINGQCGSQWDAVVTAPPLQAWPFPGVLSCYFWPVSSMYYNLSWKLQFILGHWIYITCQMEVLYLVVNLSHNPVGYTYQGKAACISFAKHHFKFMMIDRHSELLKSSLPSLIQMDNVLLPSGLLLTIRKATRTKRTHPLVGCTSRKCTYIIFPRKSFFG